MSIQDDILDAFHRMVNIAERVQRWLFYLLIIGLLGSVYLAWSAYSSDSSLWWNVIKGALLLTPALVWAGVYHILSELRNAPDSIAELTHGEEGVLQNLNEVSFRKPQSLIQRFCSYLDCFGNNKACRAYLSRWLALV